MFRTKVTFAEWQTPEQRAAHAAHWRRKDARQRLFNNLVGFWRACRKPLCRRNHACCCDMHACFQRHWWSMPEHEREYWRGCLTALKHTRAPEALQAAGRAAREAYLKLTERRAPPEAARPAAEARCEPDPRIRTL